MDKLRVRSPWVPSCLGQSCTLQGRRARSSPSIWDSVLQEQKSELRKRLTYTTNRLQRLESEFGSTRSYLEVELRRAQEELEKVTLKLRRIQTNYMSLQRINQELEQKLNSLGKHYDEEKRALSHEILALNNHLLDARLTIDKLLEDNELYRKDCNLAAQLLQCRETFDRVQKVSELPVEFQERLSLHLEKHGCSLPTSQYRSGSVPLCVIAKVLEKPEPSSVSSPMSLSVSVSEASTRDLAFREGMPKSSLLPPYKEDTYCSDSALFCLEESRRERDRRPSVDAVASSMSFLQTQNSTDSAAGEEEAGAAAAYPEAYREAYPEEYRRQAYQAEGYQGEAYRGEAYRGKSYQDEAYRGKSYQAEAYRGKSYQDEAYRGKSYQDEAYRGKSYQDEAYRGKSYQDEAYRGKSYQDEAYRGESFQDEAYRGESFQDEAYRGKSYQDEAYRGKSYQDEAYRGESFPGFTTSLPTSSSYSSFSVTSEERERGEASTLTASQRAAYLGGCDQLFQRPQPPTYQSSRPYAKASTALLQTPVPPEYELETTFPSYQAEPFSQQAVPKTSAAAHLWGQRAKSPASRLPKGEARSRRDQWRPVHMEDLGAHAFPAPSKRPAPRSSSQRYYSRGTSANLPPRRSGPLYANYKANNLGEDSFSHGHQAESCFLGAHGSAKPMPGYAASEDEGERERPLGQLSGVASPEPDSLFGSRESFEPSSMEGSPEMHRAARRNPQAALPRSRSAGGLSRKDSLTKAQLYGTLLN
uniref:Brain enriched guanylate kinase associated n=1 Tax=Pipistrellus kuhlii TaxID=59472 RepID=A0A7J7SFF8_PIPKU|nr:brain enriched guanylate kinase associated [Pipistrellus kuhlii]